MNNPKPQLAYFSHWILVLFSLCTLFIHIHDQDSLDIRYRSPSTIPFDWELDIADTAQILDTVTGELVYQVTSKKGYPLYFYQEVSDNVCFDNKCRPIDLKIYWNITGRYFGFTLEDGEFLSRRDHEAFDSTDYGRLHTLLADPLLPFFNLSFEELVDHKEADSSQVDGVTGATSKQLSDYVVAGAAYTTYVLWTSLYGSAQTVVRHATESQLNSKLLSKILESSSSMDRIWALGKIKGSGSLDSSVEKRLLDLIEGDDFFVSYTAIQAITPVHLISSTLQDGLFSIYQRSKSNLRKPILEKLYGAPHLSQVLLLKSYDLLPNLNGNELGQWLKLYDMHSISDLTTCRAVARMLNSENYFIANKAYSFLIEIKNLDQQTDRALRDFENKKR